MNCADTQCYNLYNISVVNSLKTPIVFILNGRERVILERSESVDLYCRVRVKNAREPIKQQGKVFTIKQIIKKFKE